MLGACTATVFVCGAQFSGDIRLQDGLEPRGLRGLPLLRGPGGDGMRPSMLDLSSDPVWSTPLPFPSLHLWCLRERDTNIGEGG